MGIFSPSRYRARSLTVRRELVLLSLFAIQQLKATAEQVLIIVILYTRYSQNYLSPTGISVAWRPGRAPGRGVRTPFLGPKWGVRGGPRGGPEVKARGNLLQKPRVWGPPPKMAPGPPRARFLPGPPRPRLSSLNPVTKAP